MKNILFVLLFFVHCLCIAQAQYVISGCTSAWADNYNESATEDDGSCYRGGCMAYWADNYDAYATFSSLTIPEPYTGNTGSNMTLILTQSFISSLPISTSSAYVVAKSSNGMVVGSAVVAGVIQTSIAIWGDDTFTPEVDGAFENESISFQLVDGETLYDIQMPTTVSYIQSGIMAVTSAASFTLASGDDCYRYGCTSAWADNYDALSTVDDGSCIRNGCTSEWANNYDALATDDDGSCYRRGCMADWADNFDAQATDDNGSCYKYGCKSEWADNYDIHATISTYDIPEPFSGNTGANMNLMLLEPFMNSLNVTNMGDYIVALDPNGLVVGSEVVAGVSQTGLAIWGDDSSTPEVDGALDDVPISFQLVDGDQLYDLEMPTPVFYILDSLVVQTSAASITLVDGNECFRYACMSEWADNYDELATIDNVSSCVKYGCMSEWADNFDEIATDDDGSCFRLGCMQLDYCNYDPLATVENNTCIGLYGCMDENYIEYDANFGCNDQSKCSVTWKSAYQTVQSLAIFVDIEEGWNILGYTHHLEIDAVEAMSPMLDDLVLMKNNNANFYMPEFSFNGIGNLIPGQGYQLKVSRAYPAFTFHRELILGCMDSTMLNFDPEANFQANLCIPYVYGCVDSTMFNYDVLANTDDGSCEPYVYGCIEDTMFNFNAVANTDDGSCTAIVVGCTDVSMFNYNAYANTEDNSCVEVIYGCTDELAINFDPAANTNGGCFVFISADTFTEPVNTGANMTLGVNASKLDQFEGGTIGAFIELDGVLTCVGSETISTGFFGLPIWGDDSSTPEADGLASGAIPTFAILYDGRVFWLDPVYSIFHNGNFIEVPQFTGYVTNSIANITDANLFGAEDGCNDDAACNTMVMYSDVTYFDDGSCTYASIGYDCEGVCLNDVDGDGVCD